MDKIDMQAKQMQTILKTCSLSREKEEYSYKKEENT